MIDDEKSGYDTVPTDPTMWDSVDLSTATKQQTKDSIGWLESVEKKIRDRNSSKSD